MFGTVQFDSNRAAGQSPCTPREFFSLLPLAQMLLAVCCLIACCLIVGCKGIDLRGEPFPDDPLARAGRQLRVPERDGEMFGVSNKARQIERNLGIGAAP